jgi:TPR repeat protein
MLAEMFLEGRGVPQDPEQAVSWYSKAADQGDSNAQIALFEIYEAGIVPQDLRHAAHWYREAEAAETADRIPPSHLWQGRESQVLRLKTPRGIEMWKLLDGRPRFVASVREKASTV